MAEYKSAKKRLVRNEKKSVGDQANGLKARAQANIAKDRTQANIARSLANVKNKKNPAADQANIAKTRTQANISRSLANVKKVTVQLASGGRELATDALKVEQPILHRKADRGPLLKNTAVRKLSRLSKGINV